MKTLRQDRCLVYAKGNQVMSSGLKSRGIAPAVISTRAMGIMFFLLGPLCAGIVEAMPVLPVIPPGITNITSFGATGDGVTDNTTNIQNAINAASAAGGGTVEIPAGTFLSGPLTLANNLNLQIDSGATLKMLPINLWTNLSPQSGNGQTYGNLLYARGVTNLEISGSGTIDGNGADWWTAYDDSSISRPYMIFFNGNCGQVMVQGVTVQNPPKMHFVFKGADNNITFQNMTINTTAANAANTDGIDLVGSNCLVQNCTINAGDDNIALGSSSASAVSADILVTNCTFGTGHGVSIGSNTAGGVSDLTVVNCTFNGTDYGIRMKSNDATSGGSGEGGIVQNLSYLNLTMNNIVDGAVVIYSYYGSGGEFGTPTSVTPYFAATQAVDSTTVPVWRNIIISNVTATVASGGVPGIIWARMEVPATNIVFNHVNISASKPFDIYNAAGIQFVDSQINVPAGATNFLLYNAQLIVSNSVPTSTVITFDGLTTNGYGNSFTFFNAQASLRNTNAFGEGPLTLEAGTFTVNNNLSLFPATTLNYLLGTNAAEVAVVGDLVLGGTNNIFAGDGLTKGNYTLMTYTGNLSGDLPVLGATPAGYAFVLDTNTVGQVNLLTRPPVPTGLHIINQ
jgi:hypothetical protein